MNSKPVFWINGNQRLGMGKEFIAWYEFTLREGEQSVVAEDGGHHWLYGSPALRLV